MFFLHPDLFFMLFIKESIFSVYFAPPFCYVCFSFVWSLNEVVTKIWEMCTIARTKILMRTVLCALSLE